ncbi:hypothetical protein ACFW93_42270 [Streptomyces canus]
MDTLRQSVRRLHWAGRDRGTSGPKLEWVGLYGTGSSVAIHLIEETDGR